MENTNSTQKIEIIAYGLGTLSVVLGVGVIVAGAHLNDVVAHAANTGLQVASAPQDMNKKVTSELHNHIEKQTLKSIVKAVSDDGARTDRKHIKRKSRKKRS